MPGCTRCGRVSKPGAAFCGGCGHPVERPRSSTSDRKSSGDRHAGPPASRGYFGVGLVSGLLAALCQEWVARNLMGVPTMAGWIRFLPFFVSLISSYRISRR